MANHNPLRLIPFGLLLVLSASFSAGQEATVPSANSSEENAAALLASTPKTFAETAPNPPKVTCKDGQLTIAADNSTLGSILTAVHACVGAKIDIPDEASATRSFDQLGPGPVRQVLIALLNGTDFNYMIGSSVSDPQKVETVLLLVRAKDGSNNASVDERALTPARRAWLQVQSQNQSLLNRKGASSDENSPAAADVAPEPPAPDHTATTPADNPGASATPSPTDNQAPPTAEANPAPAANPVANTSANAPTVNPGGSTEEKINDMQQMFEQRRQMIQNQTAPPK